MIEGKGSEKWETPNATSLLTKKRQNPVFLAEVCTHKLRKVLRQRQQQQQKRRVPQLFFTCGYMYHIKKVVLDAYIDIERHEKEG